MIDIIIKMAFFFYHTSVQCSVVNAQLSMLSCQCTIVNVQCEVFNFQ